VPAQSSPKLHQPGRLSGRTPRQTSALAAASIFFFWDDVAIGSEWVRYTSRKDAASVGATSGFNGMNVNGFVITLNVHF